MQITFISFKNDGWRFIDNQQVTYDFDDDEAMSYWKRSYKQGWEPTL